MNIFYKFVILEAAVLSAIFLMACPALANGKPLHVTSFKPLPYSLPMPVAQKQLSRLGKQFAADTTPTGRLGPTGFPISAIGDFPLPKLNFPREVNQFY